jgi:hypothetical protein
MWMAAVLAPSLAFSGTQLPCLAIVTPWHAARHVFIYVRPSEPQTGLTAAAQPSTEHSGSTAEAAARNCNNKLHQTTSIAKELKYGSKHKSRFPRAIGLVSGGLVQASGSLSLAESAAQAKLHQTRAIYQDLIECFNDIGHGFGHPSAEWVCSGHKVVSKLDSCTPDKR